MPTIKAYANSQAMPPQTWLQAVEASRHVIQVHVLVLSLIKAGVVEGLVFNGVKRDWAQRMARDSRVDSSPTYRLLVDAGVVDPTKAGVYVWQSAVKDMPIVRVDEGVCTVVGHFRYDHQAGLTVEGSSGGGDCVTGLLPV